MNKSDADRLLAALPAAKNLDVGDYIPKRNGGYIAAQIKADAEEARLYNDPMYGYQPSPSQLHRIAMQINTLSTEEFICFEQEVGTRFARKLLLWSIKKCQRKAQKSPVSMAALSAAIMPSGLEQKLQQEISEAAPAAMKPSGN